MQQFSDKTRADTSGYFLQQLPQQFLAVPRGRCLGVPDPRQVLPQSQHGLAFGRIRRPLADAAEPAGTGATATICALRGTESGGFAASGPLCLATIRIARTEFLVVAGHRFSGIARRWVHDLTEVPAERS